MRSPRDDDMLQSTPKNQPTCCRNKYVGLRSSFSVANYILRGFCVEKNIGYLRTWDEFTISLFGVNDLWSSFLANIVLMCSEVNILWLLTLPTDGFHPVVLKQRSLPSRKTTCLLFCKHITDPNDKKIAIHYIIPLSSKAMKIVEVLLKDSLLCRCYLFFLFFCFYGCWWILFVPLFPIQVDWVNFVRSKTVIKDQTIKDDDHDNVHLLNTVITGSAVTCVSTIAEKALRLISAMEVTLSKDELRMRLFNTFKNKGVLDKLKVSDATNIKLICVLEGDHSFSFSCDILI